MHGFLPYLIEVTVRSSLLLAFLLTAVGLLMKRATAAERYGVLLPGLLIVALMPLIIPITPSLWLSWSIPWPKPTVLASPLPLPAVTSPLPVSAPIAPVHPLPSIEKAPDLTFEQSLAALWMVGMLVQFLLLTRALWTWRRIRQDAQILSLSVSLQRQARTFAGTPDFPAILTSPAVRVPLLAGWWNPVVLLPEESSHWSEERLAMVLCHELAHFRRGDTRWLPLGTWLRIVYWWHPLVWLALNRLRREREAACDDLVLNQSFRASDYADLLIGMAQRSSSSFTWQAMALAMATSSFLSSRIDAILDSTQSRQPPRRSLLAISTCLTLALGGFLVAATLHAEDKSAIPASTSEKTKIEIGFKLIEIDEATYQQQSQAIDSAVAAGDLAFFAHLKGSRYLAAPTVTTAPELKVDIDVERQFKLNPLHGSSGSNPITLGVGFEGRPSLTGDGLIALPCMVKFSEIHEYKSIANYSVNTTRTRYDLKLTDGKPYGFWIDEIHPYSLIDPIHLPGKDPATLPPPVARPNRVVMLVTAQLIGDKTALAFPRKQAPVPPKPTVGLHFTLVEVSAQDYNRQARVMDQALAQGDLHFFDHQPGVTIITSPDEVKLAPSHAGWFSAGQVVSYIDTVEKKPEGKSSAVLNAKAVFLGLNGDLNLSVSPQGVPLLSSKWQLTELTGFSKPSLGTDVLASDPSLKNIRTPEFKCVVVDGKELDLTPGTEHGFWLENTLGSLKSVGKHIFASGESETPLEKPQTLERIVKANTPSRVAIFTRAEPLPQ